MTAWLVHRCAHCGKLNTRVTGVTGKETPANGDLSICDGCTKWSVFDTAQSDGTRKPDAKEQAEIDALPECREAEHILNNIRSKRS